MPMAGPDDPGAALMILQESVKRGPFEDERIHEDQARRRFQRPPGDVLVPSFLAALVLGPFRV